MKRGGVRSDPRSGKELNPINDQDMYTQSKNTYGNGNPTYLRSEIAKGKSTVRAARDIHEGYIG